MSVRFHAPNESTDMELPNGNFQSLTFAARMDEVPVWNGCHDGQFYSPEQCRNMALRARQLARYADSLEEIANAGGGIVS